MHFPINYSLFFLFVKKTKTLSQKKKKKTKTKRVDFFFASMSYNFTRNLIFHGRTSS